MVWTTKQYGITEHQPIKFALNTLHCISSFRSIFAVCHIPTNLSCIVSCNFTFPLTDWCSLKANHCFQRVRTVDSVCVEVCVHACVYACFNVSLCRWLTVCLCPLANVLALNRSLRYTFVLSLTHTLTNADAQPSSTAGLAKLFVWTNDQK